MDESFSWKLDKPFDDAVETSLTSSIPFVYAEDGESQESFRFYPWQPWKEERKKLLKGIFQLTPSEAGIYEMGKLIYVVDIELPFEGIAVLKAADGGIYAWRGVVEQLYQDYLEGIEIDGEGQDSITIPVSGLVSAKFYVGEKDIAKKVGRFSKKLRLASNTNKG